jgi:hypothetical protein
MPTFVIIAVIITHLNYYSICFKADPRGRLYNTV